MTVYAVTWSDKASPHSILPGKRYEVVEEYPPHIFKIRSETGRLLMCPWKNCPLLCGDSFFRIEDDEDSLANALKSADAHDNQARYHAKKRDDIIKRARSMMPGEWIFTKRDKDLSDLDMSDPDNWLIGDTILCENSENPFLKKGREYTIKDMAVLDGDDILVISGEGEKAFLSRSEVTWVGRPT